MKKILVQLLFLAVFLAPQTVFSQTKVSYNITAEANALMCPFLSPKLMELLTKKGAEAVYKDDKLAVHFSTLKDLEMTDEFIKGLIDQIGYEPRLFTIVKTYE
jgi:hypothetical protein